MSRGSFIGGSQKIEDLKGTFLVDKAGNYVGGKYGYADTPNSMIVGKDSIIKDTDDYPYPEIVEHVNTAGATTTSYTVTLPVCEPGELIMVHFKRRQDATSPTYTLDTAFSGTNWILANFGTSYATDSYLYYKIAEGSGLDAFRMNLSAARTCYATAWRIKNANRVIGAAAAFALSNPIDPPLINVYTQVKGIWLTQVSSRSNVTLSQSVAPSGFDDYYLAVSANADTYFGKFDRRAREIFPVFGSAPSSNTVVKSILICNSTKTPLVSITNPLNYFRAGVDVNSGDNRPAVFSGSNFISTDLLITTSNITYIFFKFKAFDGQPASENCIIGAYSSGTSTTRLYVSLLSTGALRINRRGVNRDTPVLFNAGETDFTSVLIEITEVIGTRYWINGIEQAAFDNITNATSSGSPTIYIGALNISDTGPGNYFNGIIKAIGLLQTNTFYNDTQRDAINNYLLSI